MGPILGRYMPDFVNGASAVFWTDLWVCMPNLGGGIGGNWQGGIPICGIWVCLGALRAGTAGLDRLFLLKRSIYELGVERVVIKRAERLAKLIT